MAEEDVKPEISSKAREYLRKIYDLSREGTPVATSSVATCMGVSPSTATEMLQRLSKQGLAEHTPYVGVELTPAGEAAALEAIRHHRLIETFLAESLGLDWDAVHVEAARLEHHISEELEDRMDEMLGHPERDPHGSAIPPKSGPFDMPEYVRLSDAAEGDRMVVREVMDDDPERLRYLADIGLRPDAVLNVMEVLPFNGPLIVRVGDEKVTVGHELAGAVSVERIEATRPRRKSRSD